jgi:hypothetical protein
MSEIFQVPAECTGMQSKQNKVIKMIFETQENVTVEQAAVLFGYLRQTGWLSFSIRQIDFTDIKDLPDFKSDDRKTPSQRQRAVIYRIWEQLPSTSQYAPDFDLYYKHRMEKITDVLKGELI